MILQQCKFLFLIRIFTISVSPLPSSCEMNSRSELKTKVEHPFASLGLYTESLATCTQLRGSVTSSAGLNLKGLSTLSRSSAYRERKIAYGVLDVMDFGVHGRSGFPSPISANLVVRRSDSKDNRKRWNSEKVLSSRVRTPSSESLSQLLAPHQPLLAVIVGRAQLGYENV